MGYVKEEVYKESPTTVDDMKERITVSFRIISPLVLQNVQRSMLRRLELCIEREGQIFENLM